MIRNATIPVYDTNPYTKSKNEHLTRVLVKDVPLSVGDELIKCTLEIMKCKVRGDVIRQKRRVNNELIDCLNGDRVCYIDPPSQPLPRSIVVANLFRARVFHVGQPESVTTCSKCLETGHHASQCRNGVKCKNCRKTGHISSSCPDSVNTAPPGVLRNMPADRHARESARTSESRDQAAATSANATSASQQKSDDVTNALKTARNSSVRQPDKQDQGNNSESPQLDTTNVESQSDAASVRPKTPHQQDISYFLRPKHAGSSPQSNRGSTHEQGSEDADTLSSDGSFTDEEQPLTITEPKSPTPKKTQRKKSERKRNPRK